jgi:hypothetical protein
MEEDVPTVSRAGETNSSPRMCPGDSSQKLKNGAANTSLGVRRKYRLQTIGSIDHVACEEKSVGKLPPRSALADRGAIVIQLIDA